MKVLIFGGCGYLGSVLAPQLLKKGYEVTIFDNLMFGNHINENIQVIQGDILDMEKVGMAVRQDFDVVIHLAGIVGDAACNRNIGKAFEVNVTATNKIAQFCRLYGIRKFIFTSSCSIYGAQPHKVLKEPDDPFPVDFYGMLKVAGEEAIQKNFKTATIFRLGTLFSYSPRMRFDLVVNSFVAKSIKKKPLTVYGGTQHRPLLHLLDASDAVELALKKNLPGIFNVASGNFSILELAKTVKRYIPANISITKEIQDKRDYIVSISKLKRKGFKPKRTIADGVKEIVAAFKSGKIDDPNKPIYYNDRWEM